MNLPGVAAARTHASSIISARLTLEAAQDHGTRQPNERIFLCYTLASELVPQVDSLDHMNSLELEKLRPKLRFRVAYELGFACPDIDDVVQETLRRYLDSVRTGGLRNPEAAGAFLNGICRNVISEFRRRMFRDVPMPEVVPEPPAKRISEPELFELRDAIAVAMQELSPRDRQVLQLFYLEERPTAQILDLTHLSDANFRVVLCRAKERFRQIYRDACNNSAAPDTNR
jgi:RNA polymerase sigma-70 factor, ECF subfamily